ncbi:cyclophilin-like fold protein [Brucella grignonensis]|uniref:Cyclophilin-like family protein n=1 Tax=Brucella grignonensis TaxID=94627 RepID=A0A256FCM5_9HYPH|nr:cyclophilin-like fold protein [Brucella grignonensis]OYR12416.1 cyclophilin-like family protein [Brucella grignonensis]
MADQADIFQTVPVSGISRRSVIGGIAGLTLMPGQSGAQQAENAGHQDIGMKIRIVLEDRTLTGTLVDTPTARDFAALLPLTLTLTDYAATEKISDLPRKLSRESAPEGIDPVAGDIAYYAPWGNLAIFHKAFRYSPGLISLGVIDTGGEIFTRPGSMQATIERIDE